MQNTVQAQFKPSCPFAQATLTQQVGQSISMGSVVVPSSMLSSSVSDTSSSSTRLRYFTHFKKALLPFGRVWLHFGALERLS